MPEVLVSSENVGKKFCRDLKKSLWYGVKDSFADLARSNESSATLRDGEFWANQGIDFEIKRGECLGLIGRNGAGKTTLLKMLNGLVKPDTGRIRMRGRVAALIALGAGFDPVLTGRENVYVNGSILGLSRRQIRDRFERIVEFSEISEFIDSPVRTYSSGMQVRLGFSTAVNLVTPDILLLDEVLAVGDVAFRTKCYRRVDELRKESAVVFVSHDMPSVARISDRVLFLSRGEVQWDGDATLGVEAYNDANMGTDAKVLGHVECVYPVESIEFVELPSRVHFTERVAGVIRIVSAKHVQNFRLTINVRDLSDQYLASCVLNSDDFDSVICPGTNELEMEIQGIPLKPGSYTVSVGLTDSHGTILALWINGHRMEVHGGNSRGVAWCQLACTISQPV
ncbi:hypothetical protein CKO51_25895 [Rhodopirellula sp. SM50]|nr:ABC transporter ATP-binding protein [Rhodopirellula sp. SM50]PAY16610.1 hypothetical protein CKO51_25895 [Rhodopirellula sp. SM50]